MIFRINLLIYMIACVCYLCLVDKLIFVETPNLKGDSVQIFRSFKMLFELNNCYNKIISGG